MNKTDLHVVLITSGQPSLNPRVVKEADALIAANYKVTVIYQYWNQWATNLDKELLPMKKWKSVRIGGTPNEEKGYYWRTRFFLKIGQKLGSLVGFFGGLAELAIGRCTFQLINQAKRTPADLYIAHNLGAIPAAVAAAKKHSGKCGFDAEDFHRYEMSNDDTNPEVRLKKILEEKYFPQVDYLTTSSPEIAKKYKLLFPALKFHTILNVFPKSTFKLAVKTLHEKSLKIFWFSQNVGLSRGLQDVIEAMKILEDEVIEFHVLGFLSTTIKNEFDQIVATLRFNIQPKIIFHEPIPSTLLISFANNFDIGLATEPGFSTNNDIALSNKIFTYIQSSLAVIASDTTAQSSLLNEYPNMGMIYKKSDSVYLSKVLKNYLEDRALLLAHQKQAYKYATEVLNWEIESKKFLSIVKRSLKN